jgi:hypothetical protein
MMPEFVKVDSSTFYADYWPKIKRNVEVLESNWPHDVKGVRTKVVLPIVIKWGYKNKSKENIIIAISKSGDHGLGDEYWVHERRIEEFEKLNLNKHK